MRRDRFTLVLCLLLAFGLGGTAMGQETFTATWSGLPAYIPDGSGSITGVVFVPQALEITDVDLQVNITHPKIKDLRVELISPVNTKVRVADRVCDTHGDFDNTLFDDEAGQVIGSVCPPGSASYVPDNELAKFAGENSFGIWGLKVEDREKNDFTGFLLGYTITFTANRYSSPTFTSDGVVSEASKLSGPVAPGQMVSIYGGALGPAEPLVGRLDPDTGALPTELGGVQVTVGDVAAPISFASLRKLTIQIPWGTPRGQTVPVQVTYQGSSSGNVNVDTRNTAPGIYSLDDNGRGQAKVINSDGTLNGRDNPADRGSVLVLYATGLGEVQPEVGDGAPAPPSLSSAVFDVTAKIDGVDAPVYFAGLAPGYIGVYQLNIVVPGSVIPQNRASLEIENDGRDSQERLWISVR